MASLLRAREGMGPVNSRQPDQKMRVPNPTENAPADEDLRVLSARDASESFFMLIRADVDATRR
jgi:hypothetical protein